MAATKRNALPKLIASGYKGILARAAKAAVRTITINNSANNVMGGTNRSRVCANRSLFKSLAAENSNAGDLAKINPM